MVERVRHLGPVTDSGWCLDLGFLWRCGRGGEHQNERDAVMCETGQLPQGWGCPQSATDPPRDTPKEEM